MIETGLPKEIEHLDFPTYQPIRYVKITQKIEKKKEPGESCLLGRNHPYDSEHQPCGRQAYVLVDLLKPCGMNTTNYPICKGCWTEVEEKLAKTWVCGAKSCRTEYVVKDCLIGWKRIT